MQSDLEQSVYGGTVVGTVGVSTDGSTNPECSGRADEVNEPLKDIYVGSSSAPRPSSVLPTISTCAPSLRHI